MSDCCVATTLFAHFIGVIYSISAGVYVPPGEMFYIKHGYFKWNKTEGTK